MTDVITLTGLVATTPRHIVTGEGLQITSFRLASTQRRYDRSEKKWVDGDTNWFTITTFRQLAANVVSSVQKGQRIVVTGRLRIRDWATDEKKGTNVEVDAEALGHDLTWGTASFTRSVSATLADSDESDSDADSATGTGDDEDSDSAESRPAVLIDEPAAALPF